MNIIIQNITCDMGIIHCYIYFSSYYVYINVIIQDDTCDRGVIHCLLVNLWGRLNIFYEWHNT